MSEPVIREARPDDAERLLEIYAYYVADTAVTFEYDVPSVEEFRERVRHTLRRYPYLSGGGAGRPGSGLRLRGPV